jgi:transcriptional regulator with GAF, ATPase, and Fis domain
MSEDNLERADLQQVLRGVHSLALGGCGEYNSFFRRVVSIVVELTGAEKVVAIVRQNSQLQVVSRYESEGQPFDAFVPHPAEASRDVPLTVVDEVKNSCDVVILNKKDSEARLKSDPYFSENHPQSILCIPLLLENELAGMLYLEIGKTGSGFSQHHVDVLALLTSHAAPLLCTVRYCEKLRGELLEHREAEKGLEKALSVINKLKERLQAENSYLQEEMKLVHNYENIVGRSDAIKRVLVAVEQVAGTDSTVLITGETGTGKELLAHAIHKLSSRGERTLVTVNCAALPSTLIESELFGHEKGAFTGASSSHTGRFEVADGGTIFLDEIAEISPELQAKLLRVLQESRFERLGSSKTLEVDVRIIAATNRNLSVEVREGKFREDLYYRVNVFPIHVPSLRERRDDIPQLVWSFVSEFSGKLGKRIESIPEKSLNALVEYSWPGNIRELRNVIERSMILSSGGVLHVVLPEIAGSSGFTSKRKTLEQIEREHIVDVLESTRWRVRGKDGAAEILGLKPTTLESRMSKLGIFRS